VCFHLASTPSRWSIQAAKSRYNVSDFNGTMVPLTGLEPVTPSLRIDRANRRRDAGYYGNPLNSHDSLAFLGLA
jgi:hypothetical protein